MENFESKTVVITGGGSGIGRAFARRFGEEGARLVLADVDEQGLDEASAELRAAGRDVVIKICDVSDIAQVEQLADEVWSSHGRADVIFNNAGIATARGPAIETDRQEMDRIFGVNLFGVWNGVSVFGKRFVAEKEPSLILNTGSENSFFIATPQSWPYVATKHAVWAMTESLREEMPDRVGVGLLIPGFVNTPLVPVDAGMDVDRFTEIAMPQIKAGEFYIVTHAYNAVKIEERIAEIRRAYETWAPRHEGDDQYDVRTLLRRLSAAE